MILREQANEMAKVLYHYGCIDNAVFDKVKIICPFHKDQRPSMVADLQYGNCHCFGCGVTVNPLQFIMLKEQCNELMACVKLSEIMSGKAERLVVNIKPRKSNKAALEDARHYFYTLPKTDWYNVPKDNYIRSRGFGPKALTKLDFRENYNGIYGLAMPMLDLGKFKGYVCRATVPVDERKYLYNAGFSRYNSLIGNYDKPWPIITEGFLDMARCVQFGVNNAACILGWKATDIQISKLQQYTNCVISGLDNTPTGDEGTELLEEYFHVVRFQFPGHRKDLGELDPHEWNYAWRLTKAKVLEYNKQIERSNHYGRS